MNQVEKDTISRFLRQALAKLVKVDPDVIDPAVTFDRFGLDSAGAFKMTAEINKRFDVDLEATVLYDYPTIEQLTAYLASQTSSPAA